MILKIDERTSRCSHVPVLCACPVTAPHSRPLETTLLTIGGWFKHSRILVTVKRFEQSGSESSYGPAGLGATAEFRSVSLPGFSCWRVAGGTIIAKLESLDELLVPPRRRADH